MLLTPVYKGWLSTYLSGVGYHTRYQEQWGLDLMRPVGVPSGAESMSFHHPSRERRSCLLNFFLLLPHLPAILLWNLMKKHGVINCFRHLARSQSHEDSPGGIKIQVLCCSRSGVEPRSCFSIELLVFCCNRACTRGSIARSALWSYWSLRNPLNSVSSTSKMRITVNFCPRSLTSVLWKLGD